MQPGRLFPLSAEMICRRAVVADWQIGKISTGLLILVLLGLSLDPDYSPKFLSYLALHWGLLQLSRCFLAAWRGGGIYVKQEELVQCEVLFLSILPNLPTTKFDYKKTLFLYCLMKASWFQILQIHSRPVWWVHASKTHKFKAFCTTTTVHNNPQLVMIYERERAQKYRWGNLYKSGGHWFHLVAISIGRLTTPGLVFAVRFENSFRSIFFPIHIHICKPTLLL